MSQFNEDQVRQLALMVGITIEEAEISEVTNRFSSLMAELGRLKELDLSDIQPVNIFPEES